MTRSFLVVILAVGCGGASQGVAPLPDSTLTFPLGTLDAERFSSMCGVANPPFTSTDLYSISLFANDPVPHSAIEVRFQPTIALHEDLPVTLLPLQIISESVGPNGVFDVNMGQPGTFATAADDASFTWAQGGNPSLVDAQLLDSVTLHFDTLDGNHVALTIDMQFHDGGVLDLEVDVNAVTAVTSCPAG